MKNLIIGTIALFIGMSMQSKASGGDDKNTAKENSTAVKSGNIGVGLEVDFGRRSRNCDGRGICYIRLVVESENNPTGRYSGGGNGTLTLSVPVEYINRTQADKMKNLKGQNEFTMEEDYAIPSEVSEKLGAEGHMVIRAGKYPMTLRDGILTIVIGDML